jgi:hypothetical protein
VKNHFYNNRLLSKYPVAGELTVDILPCVAKRQYATSIKKIIYNPTGILLFHPRFVSGDETAGY